MLVIANAASDAISFEEDETVAILPIERVRHWPKFRMRRLPKVTIHTKKLLLGAEARKRMDQAGRNVHQIHVACSVATTTLRCRQAVAVLRTLNRDRSTPGQPKHVSRLALVTQPSLHNATLGVWCCTFLNGEKQWRVVWSSRKGKAGEDRDCGGFGCCSDFLLERGFYVLCLCTRILVWCLQLRSDFSAEQSVR